MTQTISVDTSAIVDTQNIDASDVTTPIANLKTGIENTLNGVQQIERLLFVARTILTISSGSITPTQVQHTVAAETGTVDDLDTITAQNERMIVLRADAGDTITIKNGTGNITVWSGQDITLIGNKVALLWCLGSQWCVIGDGGQAAGLTLSDILTVQVFS